MDLLHSLFGDDLQAALLIIFNLILIESLLSVDNAAVLATIVLDLPKEQRSKALRYGILGAYIFRGICLLIASWLVKIWWLKPLGGFYLLYLAFNYFLKKKDQGKQETEDLTAEKRSWIYRYTLGLLGTFWATVALVELMDLAFSIDNVFAAVAFTDKMGLIYTGVFIGILAMRLVAQFFVRLMEKFKFLETAAFLVIGFLGLKLSSSLYVHFKPEAPLAVFLEAEQADLYVSVITVAIFILPVLSSVLFNFPRKSL